MTLKVTGVICWSSIYGPCHNQLIFFWQCRFSWWVIYPDFMAKLECMDFSLSIVVELHFLSSLLLVFKGILSSTSHLIYDFSVKIYWTRCNASCWKRYSRNNGRLPSIWQKHCSVNSGFKDTCIVCIKLRWKVSIPIFLIRVKIHL